MVIGKLIDFILNIDKYIGIIINNYGVGVYIILFAIIFLETGLVITPFLPGDSLLFISGAFASAGNLNIMILLIIFCIAAILGDSVNYGIGLFFGEEIFSKSRLIKHEHLNKTKEFYQKHGGKTIILARFVPIVRTFAPFVAGIGKMNYPKFLSFNIIGGIIWVFLFVLTGYFFGTIPLIQKNLTEIIIIIVVVSILPIIIEFIREKRKRKKALSK